MEITGQGFKLREWKISDTESLQKHADNSNVSRFLRDRFPYPYTMDDAIGWTSFVQNQNPVVNFAIEADEQAVGGIGFEFRDDIYSKTLLLGYWLGEAYWGRGIMPQAVKLIVDYGFANWDVVRIQAGVFSNNARSMSVLEKAGFIKEGVMKNSIVKNGIILDEHIYAVCKPISGVGRL